MKGDGTDEVRGDLDVARGIGRGVAESAKEPREVDLIGGEALVQVGEQRVAGSCGCSSIAACSEPIFDHVTQVCAP